MPIRGSGRRLGSPASRTASHRADVTQRRRLAAIAGAYGKRLMASLRPLQSQSQLRRRTSARQRLLRQATAGAGPGLAADDGTRERDLRIGGGEQIAAAVDAETR